MGLVLSHACACISCACVLLGTAPLRFSIPQRHTAWDSPPGIFSRKSWLTIIIFSLVIGTLGRQDHVPVPAGSRPLPVLHPLLLEVALEELGHHLVVLVLAAAHLKKKALPRRSIRQAQDCPEWQGVLLLFETAVFPVQVADWEPDGVDPVQHTAKQSRIRED